MTAISVSERLLEMAAFYTPLALTVTHIQIRCISIIHMHHHYREHICFPQYRYELFSAYRLP